MTVFKKSLVIMIAFASLNAWGDIKSKQLISEEAKSKAPHVSAQQLSAYMDGKEDFVLLDVRNESEYKAGHIQGAQWVPRGSLEFSVQDIAKDPDTKVVLYCRSGGRSALATITMMEMGYTNVADLDGGFKDWVAQGNAFFNMHGENKVVTYQKKEEDPGSED
jgi:rhodanese-related sulfurtransferase